MSGAIDEVTVCPKALTAAQVRAHFAASGRPRTYGGEFAIMEPGQTYLRARLARGGTASLPFFLTPVPDRYVNPLGR